MRVVGGAFLPLTGNHTEPRPPSKQPNRCYPILHLRHNLRERERDNERERDSEREIEGRRDEDRVRDEDKGRESGR